MVALLLAALLPACSGGPPPLAACTPGMPAADGLTAVCGFQNPEDLVALPGGAWLIVSQLPTPSAPGNLLALRPSDGARRVLWPPASEAMGADAAAAPGEGDMQAAAPGSAAAGDMQAAAPGDDATQGSAAAVGDMQVAAPGEGAMQGSAVAGAAADDMHAGVQAGAPVGDAACPGPPDPAQFSPHGIDLGEDGNILYVVNHGGREAVEFFALALADDAPSLQWQGCAEVPEAFDANLNDVAATPTGFVTTKMLPAGALHAPVSMLLGLSAGALLTWSEPEGWARVPGSRGFGPNGVAAAKDGSRFFFAEWGAQRIVRVQQDGSGRKEGAPLGFFPDNLTWTASGSLLAAGQVGELFDIAPCLTIELGNCGVGVRVARIDPETLEAELLVDHDPAVVVGGVSVALEHADRLWLGVFGGDRLAHTAGP